MPSLSDTATVIVDNGAGTIKAGVWRANRLEGGEALVAPNALAKPSNHAIAVPASVLGKSRRPAGHLVATEIDKAPDVSAMVFRRPHDRGIVTAFDVQRDVWSSVFSADKGIDAFRSGTERNAVRSAPSLLLTEALGVPLRVRRATDQLVYEVFGFSACTVAPPQRLAARAGAFGGAFASTAVRGLASCVVVDSGFSATTVVPVLPSGREAAYAARRLSLGGKALTNLLKQTVSFRSWNMTDETAVMNAVKERCCFVAPNYLKCLSHLRHSPPLRYVLPDPTCYTDVFGHIQQNRSHNCNNNHISDTSFQGIPDASQQILALRNERVAIPEALFFPQDIGLEQCGIAELVTQAVEACDPELHADLYARVILTGGNCRFPGFRERFMSELRPLVSSDFDVNVFMDDDPVLTTFHGAVATLTHSPSLLNFISRDKYNELGTDAILRELYDDDDDHK